MRVTDSPTKVADEGGIGYIITVLMNKIKEFDINPSDYVKIEDAFSGSYNDLTDKPLIPSIQGLSTQTYVDDRVNTLQGEIEQINGSLSGYATTQYVDNAVQNAGGGGTGQDGYSPIATVTQTANGATISITDKNGTTTATITNGANGQNGTNGTNGQDGYTPVRGTDYWTSADIQAIHDYIDTELGVIANGSY